MTAVDAPTVEQAELAAVVSHDDVVRRLPASIRADFEAPRTPWQQEADGMQRYARALLGLHR